MPEDTRGAGRGRERCGSVSSGSVASHDRSKGVTAANLSSTDSSSPLALLLHSTAELS